ncbi:MAG: hypothetical protein SGILL_003686 [Bacillariaceae sp.]
MLAEMSSFYDELNDHDGPPARVMGGVGVGGVASKSEIEMSLDLDDLEDMRDSLHCRPSHRRGSGNGAGPDASIENSNLSLSSWAQEPEATTGNLMMLGGSSLAGYWRASSLSSVYEDQNDASDDDDYRPRNISDNARSGNRQRLNSADNDESLLPAIVESGESSDSNFTRSQQLSGAMSELDLGTGDRAGKRVHFEVPARLEDIQEYEKPDFSDYNALYYMAHEIQKMMDDFKKETELSRQIIR